MAKSRTSRPGKFVFSIVGLLLIIGVVWLAVSLLLLIAISLIGRRLNRHATMPDDEHGGGGAGKDGAGGAAPGPRGAPPD